ncbi:MAG: 23S rRNA (guanosine(2251)-2'-O)-methyltransferase RlmB [Myxococcota bacterium]
MARARQYSNRTQRSPERRNRASGEQWLTGLHPVLEALRARRRRLDGLIVRAGRPRAELREIIDLARVLGVPVEEVGVEALDRRVEGDWNHQGVALRVGPLPELSMAELLDLVGRAPPGKRILALDGVEDPQNVGAVARVAESAGVLGMILTQRRAPALTPSVARASAGAIEWLPVARVSNLGRALSELQSQDYWILAAAPDAEGTLYDMKDRILTGNLVVVLGAEGKGLRPSILSQADHRVGIPMRGRVDSLNVSTAGAVLLYDLLRRSESAVSDPRGEH